MNEHPDNEPLATVRIRMRVLEPQPPRRPIQPSAEPITFASPTSLIRVVIGVVVLAICALLASQPTLNSVPATLTRATPTRSTSAKSSPLASSSPTLSTNEVELRNEIEQVIHRFSTERHQADSVLDTSRLSSVMTGTLLDNQLGVVATLVAAHCVWRFDSDSIQVESVETNSDGSVSASTREGVRACLYCNGQIDQASYVGDFKVAYVIAKTSGQWYVSQRDITDKLRNDSAKSSCPTSP